MAKKKTAKPSHMQLRLIFPDEPDPMEPPASPSVRSEILLEDGPIIARAVPNLFEVEFVDARDLRLLAIKGKNPPEWGGTPYRVEFTPIGKFYGVELLQFVWRYDMDDPRQAQELQLGT
ncbi:MAG: hypothetical protein LBL84_04020 [Candidatus Nomurabacteria bacterium]|nr:hypothetical protein [Candidatus Nomurabacteria bacterium]